MGKKKEIFNFKEKNFLPTLKKRYNKKFKDTKPVKK